MKRLFHTIDIFKRYEYIVCDSGRGAYTSLEKQSVCLADIIIFPINNSEHALRGVEFIYNYLKKMKANQFMKMSKRKKIYFSTIKVIQKHSENINNGLMKLYQVSFSLIMSIWVWMLLLLMRLSLEQREYITI